jgi:glucose-1-phosphate thymidylyltransferase
VKENMKNQQLSWGANSNIPCVIMCGGKGTRFGDVSKHKSLTPILGTPILGHVINYWSQFTNNFIFVVKHGRQSVEEYVATLKIEATFVEPEKLTGIASGLLTVEPHIDSQFFMVLGDCFCAGSFDFSQSFEYGIGVSPGSSEEHIKRSYAVFLDGTKVINVEEDPIEVKNDLCGMGHYFFQADIFDYIRKTKISKRSGELEITDTLQTIIDSGRELHAVTFNGTYANINTPQDMAYAEKALK